MDSEARSLPASGSLNSWQKSCSAGRIEGSQRCFCSAVPWAKMVGPIRFTPKRPTSSGSPGPGQLLLDDVVIEWAGAPAAEFNWPGDAHEPGFGQGGLPLA